MTSRRTHVVRVHAPPATPRPYVDIEVLDAISFKTTNGETMVINMPTSGVVPNIKDDTGAGNAVDNGASATRLSHMKRIEGGAGGSAGGFKFDIECIDVIACKGTNGEVWILNMPETDSTAYCTTDG